MNTIISVIFPTLFIAMALFFFIMGGNVILKKHPIVSPMRWFFWFMALAFSPSIIMSIYQLSTGKLGDDSYITLINPIMFSVLLLFFWRQMQGYMIMGVTDESIRDGLHYALKESEEEFEEVLTKIKLLKRDTELNLSIQSWMGTGQIRINNKDQACLKNITSHLSSYFSTNKTPPNYVTSIFYIIMGAFMVVMSIIMLSLKT